MDLQAWPKAYPQNLQSKAFLQVELFTENAFTIFRSRGPKFGQICFLSLYLFRQASNENTCNLKLFESIRTCAFLTAGNFRLFFLKKMKFWDNSLNCYYFWEKN